MEGQACADPGARTPIGASGNFVIIIIIIIIIMIIIIISCVFQFKMVSQVHSITNNTLVTIGPVKGLTGYNPFLTIMCNIYVLYT